MATEILIKNDTAIVWADTTDYAGDLGARTDQIDLTSIPSTAARQGAKKDLGAVRAAAYAVTLAVEMDVAPAAAQVVSLWWAGSVSGTAGTANPGGASGVDAAYTGTAGDSIADSILQCTLIGILPLTTDVQPVVQFKTWIFSPELRYGFPIVFNESNQAFEGDANEMGIAFTPIIDESQ